MSKDYRAKVASYGFRGRHWAVDDVARDVKPEEHIPEHFVLVTAPRDSAPEPEEELNTLSQLQDAENPKQAKKSSKK